jgi:hypothetical protein
MRHLLHYLFLFVVEELIVESFCVTSSKSLKTNSKQQSDCFWILTFLQSNVCRHVYIFKRLLLFTKLVFLSIT